MPGQLSYSVAPAVARAGMVADSCDTTIVTGLAEAACAAGIFVRKGTSDKQINPITATGDVTGAKLRGVTLYDAAKMPNTETEEYAATAAVAVMRKGFIWVNCETAAVFGETPFIRFANGAGGTVEGAVRNDADTASAVQPANGSVRFASTLAAAGLVKLELNLP